MSVYEQKQKLEKEKERLLKELAYYKKEDPFFSFNRSTDNTVDDDLNEIEGHDRVSATSRSLEVNLEQVEKALERIKDGSYGICSNCGKKIEEGRLELVPTATLCLDCEEKKGNL